MAVHPLRPAIHRRLGGPLPHQLANGTQDSLLAHIAFISFSCENLIISGISCRFQQLSQSKRQVSYALLTRPPSSTPRRENRIDLHVLSILSAFILSQDQTLHSNIFKVLRLSLHHLLIASFLTCCFRNFLTIFSIRLLMSFCFSSAVFPADKYNSTTNFKLRQQLFLFF